MPEVKVSMGKLTPEDRKSLMEAAMEALQIAALYGSCQIRFYRTSKTGIVQYYVDSPENV